MEFRNILVRATNWVGDAVMSVPALQALRRRFPGAQISILARPWVAGLYGDETFCDELIAYDAPRGGAGISEKWRLASALRGKDFDCAILFPNAFEAAALVWAARIPVRIGYSRDARGFMLTHAVAVPKRGEIPRHERFYYLELLKRSGLIAGYDEESPIRVAGASAAAQRGRTRFRKLAIQEGVVGVSPGAAYGGAKRWLPERFAEAAAKVASERRAHVAIFGSNEEQAICREVERALAARGTRCTNLAGRTTLAAFIDMAAACELYLTNDSGPMHIASALGVPTVAVFGATDDFATGPTGPLSRVVKYPVSCSPCLLRECPLDHHLCMTGVSANQVAMTAMQLVPKERIE